MNHYCIEILDLNYLSLFNNFSIKLKDRAFLTVSGANNCGKTTLIRIIDGQIYINNTISLYNKKYDNYKLTEIGEMIKTVIPMELTFVKRTVSEELYYQLPITTDKKDKSKRVKEVAKLFKLTKLLTESVESLSIENIIRLQLALAIISSPKIIIIDDLAPYLSYNDLIDITQKLKKINQEEQVTIIMVTSTLECNLLSDYTYILGDGKIVLEGIPMDILEKDNIINKAGLNLPFMMDLSVKLRDYDLIKNVELDMEKMVDNLWK